MIPNLFDSIMFTKIPNNLQKFGMVEAEQLNPRNREGIEREAYRLPLQVKHNERRGGGQ